MRGREVHSIGQPHLTGSDNPHLLTHSGNTDYYMEPTLFWNYIFDRDFPLGVAERHVSQQKPRRARHLAGRCPPK